MFSRGNFTPWYGGNFTIAWGNFTIVSQVLNSLLFCILSVIITMQLLLVTIVLQ